MKWGCLACAFALANYSNGEGDHLCRCRLAGCRICWMPAQCRGGTSYVIRRELRSWRKRVRAIWGAASWDLWPTSSCSWGSPDTSRGTPSCTGTIRSSARRTGSARSLAPRSCSSVLRALRSGKPAAAHAPTSRSTSSMRCTTCTRPTTSGSPATPAAWEPNLLRSTACSRPRRRLHHARGRAAVPEAAQRVPQFLRLREQQAVLRPRGRQLERGGSRTGADERRPPGLPCVHTSGVARPSPGHGTRRDAADRDRQDS
jgi:hypothetical protein